MSKKFLAALIEPMGEDYKREINRRVAEGRRNKDKDKFSPEKVTAEGRKWMKEILKTCRLHGKSVDDYEDGPELDKAMKEMISRTMKYTGEICQAASMIGGDMREEVTDMAVDNLGNVADVTYAVVHGVYNEDGINTTLIKAPKGKITGEYLLAMLHRLIEDIFSRSYDISDPVDLHTMVYNALMLMGVAQAKLVARAHVKNIDLAGLLENQALNEIVNDHLKRPFSNNLKGEDFFKFLTNGNTHLEELDEAREKELKVMERTSEKFYDCDWNQKDDKK